MLSPASVGILAMSLSELVPVPEVMTWWFCCRLFDRELEVVQVSQGHTDSIQSVVHVPDLNLVGTIREK